MDLYVKRNRRYRVASAAEVATEYAKQIAFRPGTLLKSPSDTIEYLKTKLAFLEHEVFCVILLNTRHRVIEFIELFRGTVDGTSVYPREIVKLVLQYNASAIVLCHNHPSGNNDPSEADKRITKRLINALNLIDVHVLDHIIVSKSGHTSLATRGLL